MVLDGKATNIHVSFANRKRHYGYFWGGECDRYFTFKKNRDKIKKNRREFIWKKEF